MKRGFTFIIVSLCVLFCFGSASVAEKASNIAIRQSSRVRGRPFLPRCSWRRYYPSSPYSGCRIYRRGRRYYCRTIRRPGFCRRSYCPFCSTCTTIRTHYCYRYAYRYRGRYRCRMRRGYCGCKTKPSPCKECTQAAYSPPPTSEGAEKGCRLRRRTLLGRTRYYCLTLRNGKCPSKTCPWCTLCGVTKRHYCRPRFSKGKVSCQIVVPGSCGCLRGKCLAKPPIEPKPKPTTPSPTPSSTPSPSPSTGGGSPPPTPTPSQTPEVEEPEEPEMKP